MAWPRSPAPAECAMQPWEALAPRFDTGDADDSATLLDSRKPAFVAR